MKKTLFVSSAAALLLSLGAIAPVAVSADDTSAVGNTTAEFTVEAGGSTEEPGTGDHGTGANADLWLVKAPDMNFGTVKIADIIAGTAAPTYQNGTVNKRATAADGTTTPDSAANADGLLQITDNRGTGAGWTLSASMDQPKNQTDGSVLDGTLTLDLDGSKRDVEETAAPLSASIVAGAGAKTVWDAAAKTGQGNNTANVAKSTKFAIKQNAKATKGQYDATVTWTLSSTVTAE